MKRGHGATLLCLDLVNVRVGDDVFAQMGPAPAAIDVRVDNSLGSEFLRLNVQPGCVVGDRGRSQGRDVATAAVAGPCDWAPSGSAVGCDAQVGVNR